jgi:hypothetical protein
MESGMAWWQWPGAKRAAEMLGQRLTQLRDDGLQVDVPKTYVLEALEEGRPRGTLLEGRRTDLGWLVDPASIEAEAQRRKNERPHPRSRAGRRAASGTPVGTSAAGGASGPEVSATA